MPAGSGSVPRRDLPVLVAIEGIDRAGKTTQTELLRAELTARGRQVEVISFPRYDAFFGRTIRALLDGAGPTSATTVDPRSMALWYALDRFEAFQGLGTSAAGQAEILLINRFTLSNAVYQAARAEPGEADELFDWVLELEHQRLGLPRPTLTVVLDVEVELSHQRSHRRAEEGGRQERPDLYERSTALLARARQLYLQAAGRLEHVVVVPATAAGPAASDPATAARPAAAPAAAGGHRDVVAVHGAVLAAVLSRLDS